MFNVSQVCGSVAYCVVAVKRNSLRVPAPATATCDMTGRGAPRAAEPVCALRGPDWVVSGHTSTRVPLAAVGVVLLMVRATIVHLRRHETVLSSSATGDESRAIRSSRVGPRPVQVAASTRGGARRRAHPRVGPPARGSCRAWLNPSFKWMWDGRLPRQRSGRRIRWDDAKERRTRTAKLIADRTGSGPVSQTDVGR
jgi:hypothetical protein